MARGTPQQRAHKPWEIGPRIWRRGRWWAVDLRYCGQGRPTMRNPRHPHWPSSGERTEIQEVAERWRWSYLDLSRDQHRARVLGERAERRLGTAIEEYAEHRARSVEPRTWAGDQTALRHLQDHYPSSASVETVEPQRMADALLDQGYKPSTVSQYMTSLRSLWGWLGLPFPAVTLPRPGSTDVRYWTDTEVMRLREAASEDVLLALDLTLFMGLRIGEVVGLRWADISEDSVRVQRQIPQGSSVPKPLKGKKARTALILPGWEHQRGEGLVVHRSGQSIGRRVQWRWMRQLLDSTGLNAQGSGWHMGRHTYARVCLESGVGLEQLRQFLGHSSIRTTETTYGHMDPDVAVELAQRAFRGV